MAWAYLAIAIGVEIVGSLSLRTAATGRARWYGVAVVAFPISFASLSLALDAGMPLGVAYGIWSAIGVALAAVASHLLFGEPLTLTMAAGILLISSGVLLVELGQAH